LVPVMLLAAGPGRARPKPSAQKLAVRDEFTVEHKKPVGAVAFGSDYRTLATAGNQIRLWDLSGKKPRERAVLKGHGMDGIQALAFAPTGKTLASAKFLEIRLWTLGGKQPVERAELKGNDGGVKALALSADGKVLASGGARGEVFLWDAAKGKPVLQTVLKSPGTLSRIATVHALAFSPDGKFLAAGYGQGYLRVWKLGGKNPRLVRHTKVRGVINALAYSPSGKALVLGAGKVVHVWGARPLKALVGHKNVVSAVAFAPDGKRVASADYDGRLVVWAWARGRAEVSKKALGGVGCLAFAPPAKGAQPGADMYLAAGNSRGMVTILRLGTAKP
jgi:WD40 repeat protein